MLSAFQTSTPSIQPRPHIQIKIRIEESDDTDSGSNDQISYNTISNEKILCITVSSNTEILPIANDLDNTANDEESLDAAFIILD
jgi:hypothetical protein